VAGAFYAGTSEHLKVQIQECFLHTFGPGKIPKINLTGQRRIVGLVCPHAGYIYSGPVAAHAYAELAEDGPIKTVVILGPNHTGLGSPIATMNEGKWRTPLGEVEINREVAERIVKLAGIVDIDYVAHVEEHSIEVQLPFLQYVYDSNFTFVPICFQLQDLASATEVGEALAKALQNENAIIIASSDLTHYEPQSRALEKDSLALKAVEALDEKLLISTIEKQRISACGYGPIAALVVAAKLLNAKEAKTLSHRTSGDITGDYHSVVGYAAMVLRKP